MSIGTDDTLQPQRRADDQHGALPQLMDRVCKIEVDLRSLHQELYGHESRDGIRTVLTMLKRDMDGVLAAVERAENNRIPRWLLGMLLAMLTMCAFAVAAASTWSALTHG